MTLLRLVKDLGWPENTEYEAILIRSVVLSERKSGKYGLFSPAVLYFGHEPEYQWWPRVEFVFKKIA